MNIKGLVVAAAMMGSAAAAMGCNMPALDTSVDASDLASQVAEGSAPETSNWFSWRVWFGAPKVAVVKPVARTYYTPVKTYYTPGYYSRTYVKVAPPAPRYERVGTAPSSRHFYVPGYWKWRNGNHEWISGHWETKRAGYTYVNGHWDRINGSWVYCNAYWKRS